MKNKVWMSLLFGASFLVAERGHAQITIMPVGDSITAGVEQTGVTGGYREPLYTMLTNAGISFKFIGATNTYPTNQLNNATDDYHNGYGSWHIQDLTNNYNGNVAPISGGDSNMGGYFLTGGNGTGRNAECPNIALLHIGANDVIQATPNMNANLLANVTTFHTLCPNTFILIASMIGIAGNDAQFTAAITPYNSYIKNTLVPSLSYTSYVPMNEAFSDLPAGTDNALLQGPDGIHPTAISGYPVMATVWFSAIEAVLRNGTFPTVVSCLGAPPPTNPVQYALTVSGGTGTGSYPAGTSVSIAASVPSGEQFVGWTGEAVSNSTSATTTLTMPANGETVTAKFQAIPITSPSNPTGMTVSVQFPQYYNHAVVDPLNPPTNSMNNTAGAVSVNNWNTEGTDTGTSPSSNKVPLIDSTGASTSIGYTYAGYSRNDGNNTKAWPAPIWYTSGGLANRYLAEATSFMQSPGADTLTLTGLDETHTYTILVYVAAPWWNNNGANPAQVTLGATSYYMVTSETLPSWVPATSTSSASPTTANYVQFNNVTGAATQTITVKGNYVGAGGFQIIDNGLAIASTTAPAGIVNSPTVPAGYHLTFDDEFDTLSISDTDGAGTKWYAKAEQCCMNDTTNGLPTAMAGVTAPQGQNPYSLIPGGGLDIRLQKTNREWYSGVLSTVDNNGVGFSQQYGYFEMKAKLPAGVGTWPAFWLLNTASKATGATAGEIDIFESYMQFPNIINTTLHNWSSTYQASNGGSSTEWASQYIASANLSSGYHVYGMLWTLASMTFYVDGVSAYSVPTPANMQQPYYLLIDLGLGGGWPTGSTPSVNDMLVQYVRSYSNA